MLTTYRLKTTQKFKIVDTLRSMTFMENQYNMVLCRGHSNTEISLYDTSLPPDRNDGIEHFERLLAMEGHDSPVVLASSRGSGWTGTCTKKHLLFLLETMDKSAFGTSHMPANLTESCDHSQSSVSEKTTD